MIQTTFNSNQRLFGTDGIRGTVNKDKVTALMAVNLAMAAGEYFYGRAGTKRSRVLIGKDTRLSGYMLEPALVAGFTSVGLDSITTGPLPTPAIAHLTRVLRCDLGVMISASHNPYQDNGLKLFGPDGMKLSDKIEKKIENLIDTKITNHLSEPKTLGRVKRLEDGNDRYIKILKNNFPSDFSLKGMRIVLDCANGAGYKSAPKILSDLGAKIFSIGVKPNGLNINYNCGSTFPKILRKYVKKFKADLGIALDGDADRVIMCDERAKIIDGDQIIAMIAKRWKRKKILKGGVIGTQMSNYGLEKFFLSEKINFKRSNVGDRYVKEMMKKYNYNLGGEQSGHIILGKFATTGDGLLVALETLFALRKGKLASETFKVYKSVPQKLLNIKVKDKKIINSSKCKKAIKVANELIKNNGRLLVRPSGTEPKVRIMCESFNISLMNKCLRIIKKTIH